VPLPGASRRVAVAVHGEPPEPPATARIARPNTGLSRTLSAPFGVLSLVDLGFSLIRRARPLPRFEVLDEVGHDKSVGPSLVAEPTTVVQR